MACWTKSTVFAACFTALVMAAVAHDGDHDMSGMDPNMPGMYMPPAPTPSSSFVNLVSPFMIIGSLASIVTFVGF
ncbi:hypothetical protein ACOSP7_018235 [Xanthoceras sorbifolium]